VWFCIVKLVLKRFNAFHFSHLQFFPLRSSFNSLVVFCSLFFHLLILSFSGEFFFGLIVMRKLFLDLSRGSDGFLPRSVWRGSLSCLWRSISYAMSLLISGGAITDNACIFSTNVGLRHPEIILQVSFKAMSTFFAWQNIRLLSSIVIVLIFLQYLGLLSTMFL